MSRYIVDETIKVLIEQVVNKPVITYESGDPNIFRFEFSKLWIEHMNYLTSIMTSPYEATFNQNVFNESLSSFRQKHSDIRLFIARENGNMIGFLQVGITPNRQFGFISDLHVKEDFRGRYIGENLMKNCFKWLSENGVEMCDLEVISGNEDVLNFYKRYDFHIEKYTMRRKI